MDAPVRDDAMCPRTAEPSLAHVAGVVLCGGRSTRMGTDKAMIDAGGVTLLQRAVDRLGEVCDPVLIAPGGLPLAVEGRRTVADALPGAGPLAGLVAALRCSPHPLLAVVAVDLPWLDPRLIRLLAARIGDRDVALCESPRGIEPLQAVYARSALPAAEAALHSPDRSLRSLVERLRTVRVTETERRAAGIQEGFARNINTPADLADLRRELHR